jgi:ABC-2 type transport system ATP-binding protein
MGILKPTSGTVRVLGEPTSRATHRRIGYVPEGDAHFPGLTGAQAVIHAGRLVGMDRSSAIERAHEVLDYVGLGEARYRDARKYSTGMRQRLKIAQAIVHDPALLLLDEPTEGVDPAAREEILDMLRDLSRSHGTSLIVSTHILHEVERFATHAVILNRGQLVEHGRISDLRTARSRGHEVRLDGPPDALTARLSAAGVAYEWRAPLIRVALDDPAAILRFAAEANLVVRQIAPVELNLDEVFAGAVARSAASPTSAPVEAASDA